MSLPLKTAFMAALLIPCLSLAQSEPPLIAVLLKGMSNPYWKTLHDGAADKAKELGLNVYIQGVSTDSEVEGQLNLCNTMLLRKPKALIFGAINNVNLGPCLSKAAKLGVALIDVDDNIQPEDADRLGIKVLFSVSSNNLELGKKAAHYLSGLKGKVLQIEGFPGSMTARLRKEGFEQNLPPELKLAASLPGDWDRLKAADITGAVITKHPDLKAIFAANDLMALGAAEALFSRNIKGVKVIGIDGIEDAIKAIKAGRLSATIAQLPYLMGQEAVHKAFIALTAETVFAFKQDVPILTVDEEILTRNDEPLLRYLR